MKCNLNPTNYINTYSTCDVECGRNTHRQSNSPDEKRWVLRADLKDTTEDIYLL